MIRPERVNLVGAGNVAKFDEATMSDSFVWTNTVVVPELLNVDVAGDPGSLVAEAHVPARWL